jgi:predicted transcriptional regulator
MSQSTEQKYKIILDLINQKKRLIEVAEYLGMSRQNLYYFCQELVMRKALIRKRQGVYELTELGINHLTTTV